MPNLAAVDDDEDEESEDSGSSGSGALSQLLQPSSSTKQAKSDASSLLSKWESGEPQEGEKPILSGIVANAETVKQALRDARDKLSAIGPSARENQLGMAEAWLSPTRTGRFGDTLANVAGAQKEQLAAERARQQQIAQSGSTLAQQLYGIDQKTLDAQLALQKLHESQWGSIIPQALRTEGAPDKAAGATPHLQHMVQDLGGGKKVNATFDPTSGKITPVGDSFTDQPPGDPKIAHAIATYQAPPLSGYALTKPGASETMDLALKENPEIQEGIYNQINQTRKEFTSSTPNSSGGKLSSLNLAISHMHTLDAASDALHNGDIKQLNRVANFLGVQTGDSAPAVYDAIKTFVGSEIANAVSQTSGVTEREAAGQKVSRDFAGPVTHAITQAYRTMLIPRMNNLKNQFYAGMGMPNFDEGTDSYSTHKSMVDREWGARILPRTAYELNPAPAQAIAALSDPGVVKEHPDIAVQFKHKYGYLPNEIQ